MNPGGPLQGRAALLTGANGDMGRAIAAGLARQGAALTLVVRRPEHGERLQRELAETTGNCDVTWLAADLSDQASVRQLAASVQRRARPLHVLVNNAGVHLRHRALSPDGIELHLAVNYLAPLLLTTLLLDTLDASGPARIVNVSSQAMADTRAVTAVGRPRPATLPLDDLQSERHFKAMEAYARSKLALVMWGYRLARHLDPARVTVNALHPGLVATSIVEDVAPPLVRPVLGLIRPFLLTPEQGARTALYLAQSPAAEGVTGKYFIAQQERRSPDLSYDVNLQEQLWQASVALTGLDARTERTGA